MSKGDVIAGCIIFALLIGVFIFLVVNDNNKMIKTCEDVGSKLNLDFYGKSNCNFGMDCDFICKFIDSEGEVIVREID